MDLNKPTSEPAASGEPGQQPSGGYGPPPAGYGSGYGAPPPYGAPPGYGPPPAGYGYAPPPGYAPYGAPPGYGQSAPSAVGWVVVGFLFFWPLGIASLLAQLKINPAWYAGDFAGAQLYAKQARTRGQIALAVGIVWIVVVIALFVAAVHNVCNGVGTGC